MVPERDEGITPEVAVDAIENIVGTFPGYRRAHAKGIAFEAIFQPNGATASITTARHLQTEPVPAIVRFSHSSPTPKPHEAFVPIKGMSVRFQLSNNEITNLTMANIPVFITKTPEAFIRLLQVMSKEPLSIKEKFEVIRDSPEFHTIPKLMKALKPVSSFASETYNSLHAYYLVNQQGEKQAVRFKWEPIIHGKDTSVSSSKIDLETELVHRQDKECIRFRLLVQLASPSDSIDDPSIMWPEDRKTIEAGVLTLTQVREDRAEELVFDPTVVTEGIECSNDPVLHFRSAVYKESASRRLRERRK